MLKICSGGSLHLYTFYCFENALYYIITTIDCMHQLCSLYMLNYSVIYSLSERLSGSKYAMHCVYLSKIENSSYHQELVSQPMPEHIDELSSSVE